jgi:TetR/AcrR family fatty acid metabolism transcriptional regulator
MTVHSVPDAKAGSKDKRERILDAAELVFAERGFFSAKVSQIAEAAGVADGTIYLYFKNKDDVLISLFESRMERVTERMLQALEGATDPVSRLETFCRTHLKMVREEPRVAEILTVELRQSAKFMKESSNPLFGQYLKLLAQIIEEGQKEKVFAAELPPTVAARAIFGMIDELALAWLLGGGEKFDIVRTADWVGALILGGLKRRQT